MNKQGVADCNECKWIGHHSCIYCYNKNGFEPNVTKTNKDITMPKQNKTKALSNWDKFLNKKVISFGGKGKKFWVKFYEKDIKSLLNKQRVRDREEVVAIAKDSLTLDGFLSTLKSYKLKRKQ